MLHRSQLIYIGIITAIIVAIVTAWYFRKHETDNLVDQFEHNQPKLRYPDLVKEFGEPTFHLNRRGGLAVWRPAPPYVEVVLRDEAITHGDHCDFLYATIQFRVPEDKICDVLSITDSLTYDQLAQRLTARCHFMAANVATLALAIRVATGETDLASAQAGYKPLIKRAADEPSVYTQLTNELFNMVSTNASTNPNPPDFACKL